jgi:dihydroxyacid dehydratase/phosphogluconate dehydratase
VTTVAASEPWIIAGSTKGVVHLLKLASECRVPLHWAVIKNLASALWSLGDYLDQIASQKVS